MLKRIFLFILTNILVVATISIVLHLLGVNRYITAAGIDYQALLIICFVWGMGGAFISLAMSRMMAKWMLGVQVINQQNAGQLNWVVEMVSQLSRSAGIPMPEVGIYESPEVNAFATGPTKNRSLVALSTGILHRMNREELAGVIGHELAHIKNGDMVTMTLLQGVVNAFVMFLSRVIAFFLAQAMRKGDDRGPVIPHFLIVFVLDIVLTMLGSIVVCWFSRHREFKADAGSAQIGGRQPMIAALEVLKGAQGHRVDLEDRQPALATMKISGRPGGLMSLFSTHPPLEDRIAALRKFA